MSLNVDRDTLVSSRDDVENGTTKKELFSQCGRLVEHYTIASWLRVAASLVKRTTNNIAWDEIVSGRL